MEGQDILTFHSTTINYHLKLNKSFGHTLLWSGLRDHSWQSVGGTYGMTEMKSGSIVYKGKWPIIYTIASAFKSVWKSDNNNLSICNKQ